MTQNELNDEPLCSESDCNFNGRDLVGCDNHRCVDCCDHYCDDADCVRRNARGFTKRDPNWNAPRIRLERYAGIGDGRLAAVADTSRERAVFLRYEWPLRHAGSAAATSLTVGGYDCPSDAAANIMIVIKGGSLVAFLRWLLATPTVEVDWYREFDFGDTALTRAERCESAIHFAESQPPTEQ